LYGVLHKKGENTYALVECTGQTIIRQVGNFNSGSPFTPQKKMRNKSDSSMLFIRRPEECGN